MNVETSQVIESIRSRRSVRKMTGDVPPREQIEQILEAASWAPNHHLTEPWRFIVIARDERKKLGEVLAEAVANKTQKTEDPEQKKRDEEQLRVEREKPLSAPVVIAAIFSPKDEAKVIPQEELVAAGAALQNLLIAAHSLVLGTMIRTGRHSYAEQVRAFLGLNEKESLLGLVYLGYPSEPPKQTKRTPIDVKVEWRGL
ncbi:MAG: nitroreductase family protein [Nitrososphaerales archaeon]